jgi:hypothetical protein
MPPFGWFGDDGEWDYGPGISFLTSFFIFGHQLPLHGAITAKTTRTVVLNLIAVAAVFGGPDGGQQGPQGAGPFKVRVYDGFQVIFFVHNPLLWSLLPIYIDGS